MGSTLRTIRIATTVMLLAALAGVSVQVRGQEEDAMIMDFSTGAPAWSSIDDVVMGGRSRSEMVSRDGAAVFEGVVSLDNNGGFASVRSEPADHDLAAFEGLELRVKGDGKRYGVRLRTTAAFDGVSYQAVIQPEAAEWREITLPFSSFQAVFRGRRVPDAPALDRSQVKTIGLIISEKQAGPFRLEIEWIRGVPKR